MKQYVKVSLAYLRDLCETTKQFEYFIFLMKKLTGKAFEVKVEICMETLCGILQT